MHFLLSNDDGYQAAGLQELARELATIGRVSVVAPDRNRSGSSNSLTLDAPLHVKQAENGFRYVNGTPTDCVHLSITGLLDEMPDMVISGINHGANLGDDVHYSGTVAAAMEGRFLGRPAIAFSLAGENPTNFTSAAVMARRFIEALLSSTMSRDLLLNINIPDVSSAGMGPYEVTRLGARHKSEATVRTRDPKGRWVYWVGPAGAGADAGPGTDFHAIANNCISVTPLQVDLSRYDLLETMSNWINGSVLNE